MTNTPQSQPTVDYDAKMQANLSEVFSQRDAGLRLAAIAGLYADDATLFEPDTSKTGHAAINAAVSALLSSLPPMFAFTATGPAVGHHGVARLRWQAGTPDGAIAVSGTDVAKFDGDLIKALYVFIDPASR